MKKLLFACVAVAGLAGAASAPGAAAAGSPDAAQIERMQHQHALLLDAHLAAMKAGLNLTADQEKNWAPFEAAIREAERARADRWRQAHERMAQGERPSPIERMSIMAGHLEKMAAQLQAVADAGKPLYDSLGEAQKRDFVPLMREFRLARHRHGGARR
ncbi:MAG: Spy/CpxP family protein refolding chaperone [Roseiarcus sp.]|jgi:Ni/Co efflux regulator RcnB